MTQIKKTCKHCGKTFVILYERGGRGHANVLRQTYCSIECKKAWIKDPLHGKKTRMVCLICRKEFYLPPSQATSRRTCSKACFSKHIANVNSHETIERTCKSCGIVFSVIPTARQIYCSQKCAAARLLKEKICRLCEVCQDSMFVRITSSRRFCSVLCRRKGQSLGLIKSHVQGRSGRRCDIVNSPYFKSSLEADYARYCTYTAKKFVYEAKVFETNIAGKPKYYTPDFYHPDTDEFVELKGMRLISGNTFSERINVNSLARESLALNGVKIVVVYMKDFYDALKTQGLYSAIPNIENRNYAKTAYLVSND